MIRAKRFVIALAAFTIVASSTVGASVVRPVAVKPLTLRQVKSDVVAGESLKALPKSLLPELTLQDLAFPVKGKCVVPQQGSVTVPTRCAFGDRSSTKVVVLDGDSFSAMWFVAVDAIAIKYKWKLYLVSRLACPFALVTVTSACQQWQVNATAYINSLDPSAIIFASEDLSPLFPSAPQVTPQAYATGVENALAAFTTPAVKKVVLWGMPATAYGSPPVAVPPNQCIASHLTSLTKCAVPISKALIATRVRDDTDATIAALATPVSVTELFCKATCPMVVDDELVFADPFHVNNDYAPLLSAALASLIDASTL
jgi:hypothetical protein